VIYAMQAIMHASSHSCKLEKNVCERINIDAKFREKMSVDLK